MPAKTMTKYGTARDNQRQRLYTAEDSAMETHLGYTRKQTIANADLQAWVDKAMAHPAVQRRWGLRKIRVTLTHGGANNPHHSNEIALGVGTRNPWVICHEIAHSLTPHAMAGHGPEYAGVYLFLIKTLVGADAAKALREAFRQGKVRVSNKAVPQPTKSVVTSAERAKKATEAKRRAKAEQTLREIYSTRYDVRAEMVRRLRDQIKHGIFGPAGSSARKAALATARHLESAEAGAASLALTTLRADLQKVTR